MFRPLRLKLTLLYLLVAFGLIALIGGGTYLLVDRYLQSSTDLALKHKMSDEFQALGMQQPAELTAADEQWYNARGLPIPVAASPRSTDGHDDGDHEDRGFVPGPAPRNPDEAYNGELAAIFVLPVGSNGQLIAQSASTPAAPIPVDTTAVDAALQNGSDLRTIQSSDGTRVRLLSYRLPASTVTGGPVVLQLGRTLDDQDRVLGQLLLVLLGLSGVSVVVLGLGSWLLAGRALRPAQVAWDRQQSFVANASHELRAPLTLLRASAEVAERSLKGQNTEARELLGDVLSESDHMARLVEDLLLLSRLDAGRLVIERRMVPLSEMLSDVQRQVGRVASAKGVQIVIGQVDGVALADPIRLRQVLLILLDNALRHTPSGGAIHLAAGPQGKQVEITVQDTGSGISPEHLPHVFERFYQGNNTPGQAQAIGGASSSSGLGLPIAKALMEAQQGKVSMQSQLGQGTVATLLLPSFHGHGREAHPHDAKKNLPAPTDAGEHAAR